MSAKSTQTTFDGAPAVDSSIRQDLGGFALVLWEIGLRDLDDTEEELRQANQLCKERGLLDGGDGE